MFLISNLRRIRSASSASARISSRISSRPRASSGSASAKASSAPGGAGVDRRPRGQHESELVDRAVGVGGDTAAHAARVVGDDAADAGDVGAGRIGPELAPVRRQHPVGVAQQGPGPDPGARAAVLDLHPGPVAADVDDDPVALGLAVEAGAAGPQGHRDPRSAAVREAPSPTSSASRAITTAFGKQPVGAGVGGVADQVDRPASAPGRRRAAPTSSGAAAPACRRRARRAPGPAPARRLGRDRVDGRRQQVHQAIRAGPIRTAPCPGATGTSISSGLAEANADAQGLAQLLAAADPPRGDAVAASRPRPSPAPGRSRPGRALDLLDVGEPLEDRVLRVAQHEEGDRAPRRRPPSRGR